MKEFFPDNAVSYFVSYYDYYQPEAYIPSSDTYIEKEATINEQIDKLRLKATADLLTRDDSIVIASVSCIYNIGSPKEYGNFVLDLTIGQDAPLKQLMQKLIMMQYERSEFDFKRGSFRVRGDQLDVYPAYSDFGIRINLEFDKVTKMQVFDPISGSLKESLKATVIYPSKHYMVAPDVFSSSEEQIRADLKIESDALKSGAKMIEAERLIKRVNYDLEMIKEMGYVNGIENYSRYFDQRKPGETPYSLIHYFRHRFGSDWVSYIDESHMTVPQVRGMYNGDNARKKTLIDNGFRLRASYDNRPLLFDEFYKALSNTIYVSATPSDWELEKSKGHIVELLVRPTGIVDPNITIKPAEQEIPDLIEEIKKRVTKGQRVLVTTLTKKTAEDLSHFLQEAKIKAEYLHSDIKTLKRSAILQKLRKQEYDVLIGVNLLREGLDLPEVTLVAILDADKEGFLRSRTSLIQTMGRAARNIEGEVILYADKITNSMKLAIDEVKRRRAYQVAYNKKHSITPTTIQKEIRDVIMEDIEEIKDMDDASLKHIKRHLSDIDEDGMTAYDKKKTVRYLENQLRHYVDDMNFEAAILVRDKVREMEKQ
ncbi:MAG: excinuclease ABC subunit UvrB, partial [Candidatus Roizmanbacteria bacterium]